VNTGAPLPSIIIDQEVLALANQKFKELSVKFDGFINVILDDWRGFRFVYDVGDSDCCEYGCEKCPIYQLLKDERDGLFNAGLYLASDEDKQLFGPKKYLNIKSFVEYQDCYVNFLVKRCSTRVEIFEELDLVKNLRFIYSRESSLRRQQIKFKKGVIDKANKMVNDDQKWAIKKYLDLNLDFFG